MAALQLQVVNQEPIYINCPDGSEIKIVFNNGLRKVAIDAPLSHHIERQPVRDKRLANGGLRTVRSVSR